MIRRRRFLVVLLLVFPLLFLISYRAWLPAMGTMLVESATPTKADLAIVLGGDPRGDRMRKAGEIARGGFVPLILVSGPAQWYGFNEADLAIRYVGSQGFNLASFQPFYNDALSTDDEARLFKPEIERRGVRKLIVITSNYHTRRSAALFRASLPGVEIIPIAAPDRYFVPERWWENRESRKTWFFEVAKTIAGGLGL